MIILSILTFIITIVITILYVSTIVDVLRYIKPENQRMDPMKVWLLLIPIFRYFWHFYIATKVSESVKAEYEDRNIPTSKKPLYAAGIIASVGFCINTFSDLLHWLDMTFIYEGLYSVITGTIALASVIAWIIYWVQLAQFRSNIKKLRNNDIIM